MNTLRFKVLTGDVELTTVIWKSIDFVGVYTCTQGGSKESAFDFVGRLDGNGRTRLV